jgi:hypothetical protein
MFAYLDACCGEESMKVRIFLKQAILTAQVAFFAGFLHFFAEISHT